LDLALRDVAARELVQQAERRDLGGEFVASGLDVTRALEHPRKRLELVAADEDALLFQFLRGGAKRSARRDLEFERQARDHDRCREVPQGITARGNRDGDRGKKHQREEAKQRQTVKAAFYDERTRPVRFAGGRRRRRARVPARAADE